MMIDLFSKINNSNLKKKQKKKLMHQVANAV
jgi:hypothetical protein